MASSTTTRETTTAEETLAGTPPKLVRRPVVIAAGVVVALLGMLGGAWLWNTVTNVDQVLVATRDVPRGAVIEAGDLAVATLNVDPLLTPVPASDRGDIVGKRATADILAGTLLTPSSAGDAVQPVDGESLVSIVIEPAQAAGLGLKVGDHVRVIDTPASGGDATAGNPAATDADVAAVALEETTGSTVVSLLVPDTEASVLAARIATGNVAVVLESRER